MPEYSILRMAVTGKFIMQPDGSYEKIDRRGRKEVINAQEIFCEEAIRRNSEINKGRKTRTFRPRMGKE